MGRIRVQEFDLDEAIRLFKITPSWRPVAKQLGVHPYCLQSRLSKLGFKAGEKTKDWVEKADAMRISGLTYKEIGEKLGKSTSAVQREMSKRHGRGGKP